MKRISFLMLIILSVFVFTNCEKEIPMADDINLVSFEVTPTIIIEQGSSVSVDVSVYASQVVGTDRTFNIEVDQTQTTTDAGNYTVPQTVTIPANSNKGSITVNIIDNGLGVEAEFLVLKLTGVDGYYVGNEAANLTIQKFCPLNTDNFVGIYTYTSEMFGDSWDVEVQKVDDHTIIVKDMIENGKDLVIVLDETDLSASVAKQPVWTHSTYGIASYEGGGSFSPCTYKIELDLELTVSAGSFGVAHEVLVKK